MTGVVRTLGWGWLIHPVTRCSQKFVHGRASEWFTAFPIQQTCPYRLVCFRHYAGFLVISVNNTKISTSRRYSLEGAVAYHMQTLDEQILKFRTEPGRAGPGPSALLALKQTLWLVYNNVICGSLSRRAHQAAPSPHPSPPPWYHRSHRALESTS